MNEPKTRREFIKLLGFGGVVFTSGLAGACTNVDESRLVLTLKEDSLEGAGPEQAAAIGSY